MTDKSKLDSLYLKEKLDTAQTETDYLRQAGVLDEIEKNKDDDTDPLVLDDIDWDNVKTETVRFEHILEEEIKNNPILKYYLRFSRIKTKLAIFFMKIKRA